MKRTSIIVKMLLCLAVVCLSACSALQAKFDTQVQAVTVPDLQAALAQANAIGDTDGAACWTEVLNFVNSLPTAASQSV